MPSPRTNCTAADVAARDLGPVAVVLVHHQGAADTIACIASIQEHAPDTPILVVDNGSQDGSAVALQERFAGSSDVALIASGDNRGYGAGCNLGIEHAMQRGPRLEHVLLLNPDTRLRPGALTALRACAQHHGRAAIIGARLVAADGDGFGKGANDGLPGFAQRAAPPGGATEYETDHVAGCCMLVDAGLLRRGLLFDETFFLYGEDVDLCRRVQALGRSLWITQAATVERRRTGSLSQRHNAGRRHYWHTRARVLLARKHGGLGGCLATLLQLLLLEPWRALLRPRRARWLHNQLRGLFAGVLARRSPDRAVASARPPVAAE